MCDKNNEIKKYWDSQAEKYQDKISATNPDSLSKDLEVENIIKYISNGMRIADIGCGNGYSTFYYAKNRDIKIEGIDYSKKMISVANESLNTLKLHSSSINFNVGDILNLNTIQNETFDLVITDRCLINLTSMEQQISAINEVSRILKPNGLYLMCENSKKSLKNLNELRKAVGLYEIKERWHNLYLEEDSILSSIKNLFELVEINKFASLYYVASRIINGKIAQNNNEEPRYNSEINKVAREISSTGDFGDFSPLKLFVLKKK